MTNKNPFSFERKEQMSTLELWQQHLQALRRASQTPEINKEIRATDDKPDETISAKR